MHRSFIQDSASNEISRKIADSIVSEILSNSDHKREYHVSSNTDIIPTPNLDAYKGWLWHSDSIGTLKAGFIRVATLRGAKLPWKASSTLAIDSSVIQGRAIGIRKKVVVCMGSIRETHNGDAYVIPFLYDPYVCIINLILMDRQAMQVARSYKVKKIRHLLVPHTAS